MKSDFKVSKQLRLGANVGKGFMENYCLTAKLSKFFCDLKLAPDMTAKFSKKYEFHIFENIFDFA